MLDKTLTTKDLNYNLNFLFYRLQYFGLTVMHLLHHEFKEGKTIVDTIVVIANSDDTDHHEIIHFGSECYGIHGYKNIHGSKRLIDVLLIPINAQVANDPRLKKTLEIQEVDVNGEAHSKGLDMKLYKGPVKSLQHRMVQMKGGRSGTTRGEIKVVDWVSVQNGCATGGLFVIATRDKAHRPAGVVGDSGAIVRSHDAEITDSKCEAFGLVHKVMKHWSSTAEHKDLYNLVICVNLNDCLVAFEEKFHVKLEFCKPGAVSSRSSSTSSRMEVVTQLPEARSHRHFSSGLEVPHSE